MPFYRILSEWDEMVKDGDLDVDDAGERANQQARDGKRNVTSAQPEHFWRGAVLSYPILSYV